MKLSWVGDTVFTTFPHPKALVTMGKDTGTCILMSWGNNHLGMLLRLEIGFREC